MHPSQNHDLKAVWLVIFIFLAFLVGSFIFVQYEILQIRNNIANLPTTNPKPYSNVTLQPFATPTSSPIATPSTPTPTPSSKIVSSTAKPSLIAYIPLTGGSTQNTDWTNINSSTFTLNINDYGTKATSIWDANLRVDNANGTTFARLYDTTHNIAVNGSEINLSDTSTSTNVTSGNLQFWSGSNTYVIQIKSLNNSTAFLDSARIKVTY